MHVPTGTGFFFNYLTWLFHFNCNHVVSVAAEFTGPRASFTDPLQEAELVGVPHRAVTATRIQQFTLEKGQRLSVQWMHAHWFINTALSNLQWLSIWFF